MALKASSGLSSTEKAAAKFGLLMVLSFILSGVASGALRSQIGPAVTTGSADPCPW